MAEPVAIRKIASILEEMNQMQDRIMRRAYDIFERKGRLLGRDLDHWLQAERELLWKPALELRETNGEFVLEVDVPGVDPKGHRHRSHARGHCSESGHPARAQREERHPPHLRV